MGLFWDNFKYPRPYVVDVMSPDISADDISAEEVSMKHDDKDKYELTLSVDGAEPVTATPWVDDDIKLWNPYTGKSEFHPNPAGLDDVGVAKVYAAMVWGNNDVEIDMNAIKSQVA